MATIKNEKILSLLRELVIDAGEPYCPSYEGTGGGYNWDRLRCIYCGTTVTKAMIQKWYNDDEDIYVLQEEWLRKPSNHNSDCPWAKAVKYIQAQKE